MSYWLDTFIVKETIFVSYLKKAYLVILSHQIMEVVEDKKIPWQNI